MGKSEFINNWWNKLSDKEKEDIWEEYGKDTDQENVVRFCSVCGKAHYEGYYCEDSGEYYCSDECAAQSLKGEVLYRPCSKEEQTELPVCDGTKESFLKCQDDAWGRDESGNNCMCLWTTWY